MTSLRARLINFALRHVEKRRLARMHDPLEMRRGFERSARIFLRAPRGSRFAWDALGGVRTLGVLGPGTEAGKGVILHFHGGGYIMGSPRTHRAMLARLSGLTGRRAFLPDYAKAPENVFPAAVEDALAAYRGLLERHDARDIVLGGDSAGGGLALALLGVICAEGLPQPAATYAFSPFTDMSFSGASFAENARVEAMLPAGRAQDMERMYMAGADVRDPRASPLFAAFRGAGPVWLSAGTTEILLDDARRMAARLRAQGVAVTEVIGDDLPHVWPMFQGLMPEAAETLGEVAAWINALSGSSGGS